VGGVSPGRGAIGRKLADLRRWSGSVRTPLDWPAVLLLNLCRTRPAVARAVQRVTRTLRVHPAALDGLWTAIDPSQLAQFVVYDEIFITRIYDLDRLHFQPDMIVDCGAFEGYFSLLARARFPGVPIVAFEPDARNFDGLRRHATQQPNLGIEIRCAAVSTTDGEAAFEGAGCGGRLVDSGTARRVAVEDLRRVIAARAPERLLLKLDVEGEEAHLIPALLPQLPRRCALFFEWHQGADAYARLEADLRAAGFTAGTVREHSTDGVRYIDAFAQRA
jgi:FkbM family methyltransferase